MRAAILILAFVSSNAFAAKGRLLQILEQVPFEPCEEIVGGFESLETIKPAFSKENAKTILSAVGVDDYSVVTRAREIYTNPQVMEMSGDYMDAGSIHHILAVGVKTISDLSGRDRGILNMAIRLREGAIIGFAQLAKTDVAAAFMKGIAKDRSKWFEISYHLDPKYWGKGYATEVVKALVDEAMANGAEGVYAQIDMNNAASGRVLSRAGFNEFERNKFPSISGFTGTIHYALTREGWNKKPAGLRVGTMMGQDGNELLVVRRGGGVPTWSLVVLDQRAIDQAQEPSAQRGDRLVQLTSTSKEKIYHGVYISVPINPYVNRYTSTLELEQLFEECSFDGKLDRDFFQDKLSITFWGSRYASLPFDASELFPDNFLELTIFQKRRIYQQLTDVIVIDEKGRNAVTRAPVIPAADE